MSDGELYTKGARIWVPNNETVWKPAEVDENFVSETIKIIYEDGKKETLDLSVINGLPPLRNPEILVGENDLTSLSYLHEPAVLYNLQIRFCSFNVIYTYCGIVLVAINPYEDLAIYGKDTIFAYRGQAMGDLDPHIFAVAEEALTKVERENRDQSIIVSGESGAGKTVSAKYTMRYFATVGGSTSETQIEKRVLASNPIMEAFGNAKTTRNDNSSRFGKYLEIDLDKRSTIIGANMRTYLLEKSRVVFQATEERNYHIFYQLCASAEAGLPELEDFRLGNQSKFVYTSQGGCPTINKVDDVRQFEETRNALTLLGFSESQQLLVFRILAAILHLGNVTFLQGGQMNEDSESSAIPDQDPHLAKVTDLLGIDHDQTHTWLCHRKIQSMREAFTKPMTKDQASSYRDALAKHIYERLFSWIVVMINKSLASHQKVHRFIGVLDIYGFETFEVNSFEQFCINYANEKLQQQFNMHVFKLEQEEYSREDIKWKFIQFYDNQPCINLIESKMGILDLLDEECKMPKGTDGTWSRKLYEECSKRWNGHFSKPRLSNTAFQVHHFADIVQYEVGSFLEKNRDTVMEEHINILRASQLEIVGELFEQEGKGSKLKPSAALGKGPQKQQHQKSVGSQFRDSLGLLMKTLNATTPHYVRCIKPNDDKAAFTFDPHRAIQQLRACGVLETVRISAAGYPSRWSYADFLQRYRVIAPSRGAWQHMTDLRASCHLILESIIKEEDKYQFGKTKIFFRAGQVAYLEKLRADRLRACAVMVQKVVRGFLQRRRYLQIMRTILEIQRFGKGLIARRKALALRRARAATVLQKHIRGFLWRTKYLAMRRTALLIQAFARGNEARRLHLRLKRNAAAVAIQKHVRRWLARKKYLRKRKDLITVQSCVRRWFARRELKRLKIEARSVERVKELNRGLENKIISLQQKIQTLQEQNRELQSRQGDPKEQAALIGKVRNLESKLRESGQQLQAVQAQLQTTQEKLQVTGAQVSDLKTEKEGLARAKDHLVKELNAKNLELSQELDKTRLILQETQNGIDSMLTARVESERRLLREEFDNERLAYQKLLKDNSRLEQRFENMQNEMKMLKATSGHQRTPSNISVGSDAVSDTHDEDGGYGSVRSHKENEGSRTKLDEIPWEGSSRNPEEEKKGSADIDIVLKLQQKLKALESEKARLEKKVECYESKEEESPKEEDVITSIRLQELERENAKMKDENRKLLTQAAATDPEAKALNLMDQFQVLQEELDRRREECIQLRTVLATHSLEMRLSSPLPNEDGEIYMAFETQKKLYKQLEAELQAEKIKADNIELELRHEIMKLQEDNERQQKLLSQNLKKSPQDQNEAILQHEIKRLTGENVDLQEKMDDLKEQIKKLKKQVKLYAKKAKSSGVDIAQAAVEEAHNKDAQMPAVKHKETHYMGMIEYKKENENDIVKYLIYELKPKVALSQLPGLPAYIFFMCIRYTDHINDDEKVKSLLNSLIFGIKKVIKKRHDELEYITLWLANTCRLLHNLKQYSGDKAFQADNTPKQNDQCLRNFDLSEYRQVLSDVAVWIYQALIKILEDKVHQLIVPAVLEHEAIPGISGNRPLGMRGQSSSLAQELDSSLDPQQALDSLLGELNDIFKVLMFHGIDPEIITQVYRQLFYIICARALNNLLLRKDMCHWSKGMQIRYNLSHLEQWCRDQNALKDTEVVEPLQPIIQASQLLQARKTDQDVDSVCDMCSHLTVTQIVKILNLYTPADDFEERVPVSFIRKIQARLVGRETSTLVPSVKQDTLLLDTKFSFPIRFPFNPSSVALEDITLPESLNLHFLKKI